MITYITKDNDRWDMIAWKIYGDPYLYEPILLENPQYMHLFSLPGGVILRIPFIDIEDGLEVSLPWETD